VRLETADDPRAAAERAASEIVSWLNDGIQARGQASLAFSRVSEPYALFDALEAADVPWDQVHVFQVDERVAPDGDPDRNAVALQAFAARFGSPPTLHLMPVTPPDTDQYAATLQEVTGGVLDAVHLGLGPDGHTASWPPGYGVDEITDRDVALCPEYQQRERMTLSVPAINRARGVVFLVTGASKVKALSQLMAGDSTIPASRVRRGDDTLVVADRTAREPSEA
jgi:6-phosphogluconolactonase